MGGKDLVDIMRWSYNQIAGQSVERLVALSDVLYGSWGYATGARLVKADLPAEVPAAICRRIVIAQSLYAFGALLSVGATSWSIAFIVLVQLNYAVAPRVRPHG